MHPAAVFHPLWFVFLQTLRVYWSSKVWELEPLSKLKWHHCPPKVCPEGWEVKIRHGSV